MICTIVQHETSVKIASHYVILSSMRTETFKYNPETLIDLQRYKAHPDILIQIFCGHDKAVLQKITHNILKELPQAKCIGTTTDGEINNQEISVENTIISISIFNHTTIKSAVVDTDDCFENGTNLAKKLITKNTKLLILFTDGTTANGEEFLKGIESIAPNVIIAGGMAGDNGRFIQTYVSEGSTVYQKGAVGISLNSDILHIKNDFSFNWQPIGIKHTINHAKSNRVYTIDNMSAVDFYAKYLGEEVAEKLPATGIEFPLIIEKNGYKIARAVIAKHEDNSLSFAGNIATGERVKLGFGNAEMIMKESLSSLENIYKYKVETFFIYSCMARRRYMPRFIQMEIKPFAMSAPTTGFFTYGEFFHQDAHNELLNQSLTIVALSEENIEKKSSANIKELSKEHSDYATTIRALTHLINQSSNDYAKEAQKVQELLETQKLFLRHAVHETHTPLAIIMSNIELYEFHFGKQKNLSNIEAAMKNIYTIYNDLGYLVKKNQVSYPKLQIELVDFIRSRIEFFAILAEQVDLSFDFTSSLEKVTIHINETKLQRIIDNNITNALKYTKEGEVISIMIEENSQSYSLKISSHSTMIENPKKIFDDYYREDETKEGLGVGLSLVKQICDEENITISLQSDENITTFDYHFTKELG